MEIIYIGHLNEKVRAYQRYKAMCDLGHEVYPLTSVPVQNDYYNKSGLLDRVLWKLGIPRDITGVNELLLKKISEQEPSVIWIDKGNNIKPSTLKKIKKIASNTVIISFSEDDMFAMHNRSLYYKGSLKYYDYVFTTKSYNSNSNELPSLGAKKVIHIGNAFDKNIHWPIELTKQEYEKYASDVSFIGSYEKQRAESMLFLAQNGIKVRVWGGGWNKYKDRHLNLIIENKSLFDDDYIKCIRSSKINLGFLRKMNRDQQTARSVEIPACKAFMLAERTIEHLSLFREGEEAEFFGSNEELLLKIQYYMNHPEKRNEISNNGYDRCFNDGYSHHDQINKMLNISLGK